jgi:4-amino-4-deoxy-L-arabinose transferase-like glycosyltransferase
VITIEEPDQLGATRADAEPIDEVDDARSRLGWRRAVPMLAVLGLTALTSGWSLSTVGWGNSYYSAAVRSMGSGWKAFFYASFDRGGYVSVDKPPLSLWVQVLSTKLFGYGRLQLLLPSVVAGLLSVALLYLALGRTWGRPAAVIGATVLALTPIFAAVNHSNNTDAVLVFMMTACAWAGVEAVRRNSGRWLVLAGLFGGLAMTAKMLAALPVIPGVLVAYLWCSPRPWRRRFVHALLGALTFAIAGLWWFAAVQLTPADARPYVGSTQRNSVFELAFERNGVNQVEGTSAGVPSGGGLAGRFPGGPGVGFLGGSAGVGRLLNSDLGTQAGWLLPLAAFGAVAGVLASGLKPSPRLAPLIVFGGWALGASTVFSMTEGVVHPYYLAQLGPPIGALVGIGYVGFERLRTSPGVSRVGALVLPIGLAVTAWTQWTQLRRVDWRPALAVVAVAFVAGSTGICVLRILRVRTSGGGRLHRVGAAFAVIGPLVAPGVWTQGSLAQGVSGPLPYASPVGSVGTGPGGIVANGGFQSPTSRLRSSDSFARPSPTRRVGSLAYRAHGLDSR